MANGEVPRTEAFLAMLALITVLIFILIYYCIMPCVKYYKKRKEEEEAWWQYDPRWNKDTFCGVSSSYDTLVSSGRSSASTSPRTSMRPESNLRLPNNNNNNNNFNEKSHEATSFKKTVSSRKEKDPEESFNSKKPPPPPRSIPSKSSKKATLVHENQEPHQTIIIKNKSFVN